MAGSNGTQCPFVNENADFRMDAPEECNHAVGATIGYRDDFIRLRIEAGRFARSAGEFLVPTMRGDANDRRWNQAVTVTLFRRRMHGPAKTRPRMAARGSTVLVSGTVVNGVEPSTA